MSLFVSSLNSGSNGNSYYIGNDNEAVLIDAGISCREIEKRLKILGLSIRKIRAVFISHEHTDHTKGAPALAERFSIPLYITKNTLRGCPALDLSSTTELITCNPVTIGNLTITSFPKQHDAEDPQNFTVSCSGVTVGVFTDMGTSCSHFTNYFSKCNAAFLETNYDDTLLENGPYPYFLKKRISGNRGHLSNIQALEIFRKHKPEFMTHLFLSHLSKTNNCPVKARDMFVTYAGKVEVIIASRNVQTPIYSIRNPQTVTSHSKPTQMCLF